MDEVFEHGYAVVIGVDKSQVEKLALSAVKKDVEAMEAVLVHPQRCAYKPEYVKLVRGEDATRKNILDALCWLRQKVQADPQATAVVYYSGHGTREEDGGYYLIPYDIGGLDRVSMDGLRAEDFAREVGAIKAQRRLVILDCCRAGGMGVKDLEAGELGTGLLPSAFPVDLPGLSAPAGTTAVGAKGIADLPTGEGSAVISSSTGEQKSWVRRDKAMSIFTYHVIEALTGHAPHADGEKVVYVTDVMKWASQTVAKSARAKYGAEQTPQITAVGDFAVAQLIGGKGVAKGLGELPPDPLAPLPEVTHVEGSVVSGGVDTRGGDFAGRDMDKSTKVTFNQQGQTVGGSQTNIGEMRGNIGHIGNVCSGDNIRVGNISGSTGVAIGRGAIAKVTIGSTPTADDSAKKELEELVVQLNELLQQTPADQQQVGQQVAEATELLIGAGTSEQPNPTMIEALGNGLKQTAQKLDDNLPGIIELTTKIAAAVAAIAGAAG